MKDTRKYIIALIAVPVLVVLVLSFYRREVEKGPASTGPRYEAQRFQSNILSLERHSEVYHNYTVISPQQGRIVPDKKYPLILHIPAFGEDHRLTKGGLKRLKELLDLREEFSAFHIFVDPTGIHGHHYFVDSEINGSVGAALVKELLPELKRIFLVDKIYLTGHSSGAWSALRLQLEYPTLFDGVWATSPDPVDFKNFYGVDLSSEEKQNLYYLKSGKDRIAIRGKSGSVQKFINQEEAADPNGNEWIAMESVFSRKDSQGNPEKLFDRETGEVDLKVAKEWFRFDLLSKLKNIQNKAEVDGKIHLYCGSLDDYFLDQPFASFCNEFKKLKLIGECELIASKGHNSVYNPGPFAPDGLVVKIWEDIFTSYHK